MSFLVTVLNFEVGAVYSFTVGLNPDLLSASAYHAEIYGLFEVHFAALAV